MASLAELLRQALERGADSLQLRVDQAPVLFVDRRPEPLPGPPLTTTEVAALVDFLVPETDRPTLVARGLHDGRYETAAGRFDFRIRLLPEGTAIAFRPAPTDVGSIPSPSAQGVAGVGTGGWPTDTIPGLLRAAWHRGASDVILSGGAPATVRLAGELVTVPGATFSDEAILGGLGATFTQARRRELEVEGSADLAVEVTDGERTHRFRANVFRQLRGIAAAFRPIWDRIPELSTLHLPVDLLTMTDQPHGLILVVGPTGAGKSTTLAVLLEHLNRTQARHIITLEDPIEHLFRPQRSLVHQREVGVHVESFSQGLRAALRECPDVILVGEMRDLDTIAAALTAAETGHLVFSTLHSGSATQAIDRIIDVFPQHQQGQVRIQLSDVLRGVVTQRLLPTVDGKGRVPILEVVRLNYAFSNLVRDRKTHLFASQLQTTLKDGNVPFDLSLSRAVKEGLVSLEVAARAAHDPQYLRTLLGAMAPG
jgi:twitching motility protein PilT